MKRQYFLYVFLGLVITYLFLVATLPIDPASIEKYNLTAASARMWSIAVALPFVAVWCVAFYGFYRVKSYANLVSDSPEGKPFQNLSNGLMILAFSFPLTGIVSSALNSVAQTQTDLLPAVTISRNYMNLIFSLLAFWLLFRAAEGFIKTLKGRNDKLLSLPMWYMPLLIGISSLFTWLVVVRPQAADVKSSSYFLPNWLLITTIVIPYLVVWFMGSLTAYRLYRYMKNVKGKIYRQAFVNLAIGIVSIVGVSIFIQFMTTITATINRLNLTPILSLIYLMVVLYALGFGFVARGAKKLKKIEEV